MAGKINRERLKLLSQIESFFEGPLVILGFVWLALLVIELLGNNNPKLETVGVVIWVVFILDFVLKFLIAPEKKKYLQSNILTIISLIVPAFRVLRVFRVVRLLRFTRSFRLVKILSGLNRSMRALSKTMKRRAVGFIVAFTAIVVFAGAAGMYAFEKDVEGGLQDYGTAVWWTTMIITTLGSEYWPQTSEGRILCLVLALYAFAVFGYITATIATFFIGKDAAEDAQEIKVSQQLSELKIELAQLKKLLEDLNKNQA